MTQHNSQMPNLRWVTADARPLRQSQRNLAAVVGWLGARRITPYHSHALPPAQAADALRLIIDREVIGKVLLV
jgi:NADPH:quinone reductase-like Zn-dependent oxidoreductase